jgi:hypothetical protein
MTRTGIGNRILSRGVQSQHPHGSPAIVALQEADMPWFWDLKETLEQESNNPHFDIDPL